MRRGGCPPCSQPCPPVPCPGSGAFIASLFAATPTDGTSALPGGQAGFTQVPGVAVAPFNSPGAEILLIDATASLLFSGTADFNAVFRVMVDGIEVPFSRFSMFAEAPITAPYRDSGAVTLRVPVTGGVAHIVSLEWASPAGNVASSAAVDGDGNANLRVIRTSQ